MIIQVTNFLSCVTALIHVYTCVVYMMSIQSIVHVQYVYMMSIQSIVRHVLCRIFVFVNDEMRSKSQSFISANALNLHCNYFISLSFVYQFLLLYSLNSNLKNQYLNMG